MTDRVVVVPITHLRNHDREPFASERHVDLEVRQKLEEIKKTLLQLQEAGRTKVLGRSLVVRRSR